MGMFLLSLLRMFSSLDDLTTVDEKWISHSNNMRKGQLIAKEQLALDVSEPKFLVKNVESKQGEKTEVYFQHDCAISPVTRGISQKLVSFGWTILLHSSYFPNLSLSDKWSFKALKHHLDRKYFD
ncbi:hypothetical protein B9Z55_007541 [Caenorhabditis nigoni]|uniref:Mos1 transposase HTH domain-containing protein n=1 Tax=Caenorhabditis nigoni TaxID=1611254 RepID=A0A2G5VA29_9PELO|nr:hypothetical protein B9Z55_007541 [Caenorhabditis nigoni]